MRASRKINLIHKWK